MVKHLFQYLQGTKIFGLLFTKSPNPGDQICRWADADYGQSTTTQKSKLGYVITLYGNPISWTTKKLTIVAQSTTEAEFVAINLCTKQVRWLSTMIIGIGIDISKPTIKNNNQGANFICKEAQLNPNSQHIEICFQYIWDLVSKLLLLIEHSPSDNMIANILTKPLG